jgi:hypothetical protein
MLPSDRVFPLATLTAAVSVIGIIAEVRYRPTREERRGAERSDVVHGLVENDTWHHAARWLRPLPVRSASPD